MPCHHALAEALHAYINAAGIAEDRKGWLFRSSPGHNAMLLTNHPMNQPGITAYLANGGALEHAQEMAAHESPRTTKLYDRTRERHTQDEVERIRL